MEEPSVGNSTSGQTTATWHWYFGGPDPRLEHEIGKLEIRLRDAPTETQAQQMALEQARSYLACAKGSLSCRWARNEPAWVYFHAARQQEPRWFSDGQLAAREVDLRQEVLDKLTSWRLDAVNAYTGTDTDTDTAPIAPLARLDAVIGMQQHLDEVAENDNRKRLHQRRQLITYLTMLFVMLVSICAVELRGDGLLLGDDGEENWWIVSVVLFGTLGGAFSSAQRVAAAGPAAKYPELRWARVSNVLRPLAGGAGALVAFAALEADVLGGGVGTSGPRIAVVCFVAGFSERFIPSIAARQESAK